MGNLKIFDTVQFSLLDSNLIKVKDDYAGAFKPEAQGQLHPSGMGMVPTAQQSPQAQQQPAGLLVRIAATHSGLITRNNGFYLPDKMKKGADSFIENYGKPVLLHHNDHKDPVGRIIQATYRDVSGAIADKYDGTIVRDKRGKEKGKITSQLIKDFSSGKMPFGMQVDIISAYLRDSLLDDSSFEGLGYIELVANITDRESIQKLLDGRYLTGSVGATTNAAVCSVCRSDWTEKGQCEHNPGAVYDGVKCFVIAGDLTYDEYSFVNVPADRHSKVLELQYNGIQDNVKTENSFSGIIHNTILGFPQYELTNKEENSMTVEDKKDGVKITDSAEPTTEPVVVVTEPVVAPETTVAPVVDSKTDEQKVDEVTTTEVKTEDAKADEVPVVVAPEPTVEPVVAEPVVDEKKVLTDKITSLEGSIEELKGRLEAQRKEYAALSQDFDALQDSVVKAKLDMRKVKESHLTTLRVLQDAKVEAQLDFTALDDVKLDAELEQTLKAVDMVKITDKLGDGMSRIPVGEVHAPIDVQSPTVEAQVIDAKEQAQIYETYMTLRMGRNRNAAEAFLVEMKKRGKLPQGFNF